jgi:hypothetical protein
MEHAKERIEKTAFCIIYLLKKSRYKLGKNLSNLFNKERLTKAGLVYLFSSAGLIIC